MAEDAATRTIIVVTLPDGAGEILEAFVQEIVVESVASHEFDSCSPANKVERVGCRVAANVYLRRRGELVVHATEDEPAASRFPQAC